MSTLKRQATAYNFRLPLRIFERLSTKEFFLTFFSPCLLHRSSLFVSADSLCSLVVSAESVLLPLYFCCFLRGALPLTAVFLKLAARPMLVKFCCWRSWKLRWLLLMRPELTAAACIWSSAISWFTSWRPARRRRKLRRSCSSPAFNNLKQMKICYSHSNSIFFFSWFLIL